MIRKAKVLVVAAHPDDETLGCGGTISRWSDEGFEVHILLLGEGMTSRQGLGERKNMRGLLKKLHKQAHEAGKILGAESVEVLNFPDNRFDTLPLLEIIRSVERKKRKIKPKIILTHHAHDLNIDHRITFQATLTACRPYPGESLHALYSFETPSSTEWQSACEGALFKPNMYIELKEKHIRAKIRALQTYKSETRRYPHPRSARTLKALAEWRGSNVCVPFAECYEVVRTIEPLRK